MSCLARQALIPEPGTRTRSGVLLFQRRPDAEVVTPELVNRLRMSRNDNLLSGWKSPVSVGDPAHVHVYLLGAAIQQGGKVVIFDQRIPATAIQGGGAALEVIASH